MKERKAIVLGFRLLQQAILPTCLKTRWSVKKNILIAISQGMIALDVDPNIPVSHRLKPINHGLSSMNVWPNFKFSIHAIKLAAAKELIIDGLSLRALLSDYSLTLRWNDVMVDDQLLALALLELTIIFLSAHDKTIVQEGLITLENDLKEDNILVEDFLNTGGLMETRQLLLAVKSKSLANEVDVDHELKLTYIKILDFLLSAPVLIAYAKKYFSMASALQVAELGCESILEMLMTPNGMVAMDKGFFHLDVIILLAKKLDAIEIVALVSLCLTDTGILAFCNGLIRFDQDTISALAVAKASGSFNVQCTALLTSFACDLFNILAVNLKSIDTPLKWTDALTMLNNLYYLYAPKRCSRILLLDENAHPPQHNARGTICLQMIRQQPEKVCFYWSEGKNNITKILEKSVFPSSFFECLPISAESPSGIILCQEVSIVSGYNPSESLPSVPRLR